MHHGEIEGESGLDLELAFLNVGLDLAIRVYGPHPQAVLTIERVTEGDAKALDGAVRLTVVGYGVLPAPPSRLNYTVAPLGLVSP